MLFDLSDVAYTLVVYNIITYNNYCNRNLPDIHMLTL